MSKDTVYFTYVWIYPVFFAVMKGNNGMDAIVQNIISFFSEKAAPEAVAFIISLLPILELRGGLLAAAFLGLEVWRAFLICGVGTLLPIPFILLFIRQILEWMKNTRLVRLANRLEDKAEAKVKAINRYKLFGLILFVAIPLPGTGAWTGALAASFMRMRFKDAFLSIVAGTLIADLIMCLFSYSLASIIT